ncbi:MAG TPA: marine proteobacterial sortase target protein [Xanthomonadales bacterium]|nr:marine proteobacterial sortase target protein [Xanthomonadales bacterium]
MIARLLFRFTFAVVLALLFAAFELAAAPAAPQLSWSAPGSTPVPAATLALEVRYDVRGLLADARVVQRFRNDSPHFLQGHYRLPLPEGAAVHTLRLRIGQRVVEGEIREKAQAQAEYRAAAAAGTRASLVERAEGNVFTTAVANVGPGETVEIEIGYAQRVPYRDGRFELGFPLTFVEPYSQQLGIGEAARTGDGAARAATVAPAPRVSIVVELHPGLPVVEIASDTHRVTVASRADAYAIRLAHGDVVPGRDFVLRWRPAPSREPGAALFVEHRPDGDYALAMFVPPAQAIDALPRELVLVIDTSGSMHGGAIAQARAALDAALARLRPIDRFNVIEFDSDTNALHRTSIAATPAAVAEARAWVAALAADDGTEMLPALDLALAGEPPKGYVRQVVFATDGAVSDEEGLYTLIEDALGEARLFPVGIGDAPNARFLEQAARIGRGASVVVRDLAEVAPRMDALFEKLDRPVLRDLAVHWPGVADAYPRALPDLYHGEPLLVVAKLARANGAVQVEGFAPAGGWAKSLALPSRNDAGVARLWAQARVEAFEDELRRGADEALVRPQLVEHALAHGLVTRYTSLVAVDRTPARPAGAALEDVAFANGATGDALAFAQGATPAPLQLLLGLAGLLLLACTFPRRAVSA